MLVGANFYAYMIGSITSIVAESDAHTKAYFDRMNIVTAWSPPERRRSRAEERFPVFAFQNNRHGLVRAPEAKVHEGEESPAVLVALLAV